MSNPLQSRAFPFHWPIFSLNHLPYPEKAPPRYDAVTMFPSGNTVWSRCFACGSNSSVMVSYDQDFLWLSFHLCCIKVRFVGINSCVVDKFFHLSWVSLQLSCRLTVGPSAARINAWNFSIVGLPRLQLCRLQIMNWAVLFEMLHVWEIVLNPGSSISFSSGLGHHLTTRVPWCWWWYLFSKAPFTQKAHKTWVRLSDVSLNGPTLTFSPPKNLTCSTSTRGTKSDMYQFSKSV